jgi:hypothetical protein
MKHIHNLFLAVRRNQRKHLLAAHKTIHNEADDVAMRSLPKDENSEPKS